MGSEKVGRGRKRKRENRMLHASTEPDARPDLMSLRS